MTQEERMKKAIVLFAVDGQEYTVDTLPDKYRTEILVAMFPQLKETLKEGLPSAG